MVVATTTKIRGYFSLTRFCPEHGYPLRCWSRNGKYECPHTACLYFEYHPCEYLGVRCECDQVKREIEVGGPHDPEADERVRAIMRRRRHDLVKGGFDLLKRERAQEQDGEES